MKKNFMIALVAIFAMGMSINAQQRRELTPAERDSIHAYEVRRLAELQLQVMTSADLVERLAQQITLSTDEKAKVLDFYEKQIKKDQEFMDAVRNTQNVDVKTIRTKILELQKAKDADLEKIIGKEKMAQYQKIREEQRANREQGQR